MTGSRLTSLLLGLELRVEKHESSLGGLGGTDDGEHPLSTVVMGDLGDRDPGSRQSSDLGDLGSTSTTGMLAWVYIKSKCDLHDTSYHVAGNGDVLGSKVWVVHVDRSFALPPVGCRTAGRSSGDTSPASSPVSTEWSSSESSSNTGPPNSTSRTGNGLSSKSSRQDAGVSSSSRVVLDGTLSSVPVLYQTLGDLENSGLDSLNSSLNFNDSLGGLRKHLLGGDHSSTRLVLDLLDLQPGSANDGTHEVVGDQQSDRSESADRRRGEGRVGQRSLEQKSCDLGKGGSDTLNFSRDGEDSVLNTSYDLGDTSLDTGSVSDVGDGSSSFTDDDTGFLGRDESSEGKRVLLAVVDSVRSFECRILCGLGRDGFC